jgi:hypothetical protein
LFALLLEVFFVLVQALALENGLFFQDIPRIIELQGRELGLGGEMQGQDISLLGNGIWGSGGRDKTWMSFCPVL